jgi:16S rRNA (cytosine1402-N4)-methyltransferase
MKRIPKDKNERNLKDQNVAGKHIPILLSESVDSLEINPNDIVIDVTVNRAGHSKEFAKHLNQNGSLICFDLDKIALKEAEENLKKPEQTTPSNLPDLPPLLSEGEFPTLHFIHSNFRNIKSELEKISINKVDKIFADLGLSSQELDISGRGFTFQKDEPLYMTLQSEVNENTLTAKDLLQTLNVQQLTDIFRTYGDDVNSYKIAKYIVEERDGKNRKIETTQDLVKIIEEIVPKKPWENKNPSTKIFQALRIAVNDEYDALRELLNDGFEILKVGGIFSIITFHSGEDRIVKTFFKEKVKENKAKENHKKIKPSDEEVEGNRRSRSAILRSITKL